MHPTFGFYQTSFRNTCGLIWNSRDLFSILQYIQRNMHKVFALLCFVVVIHWLIFPYPSGLLHWHCGNLTIAPVPAKQPWWIWINTSCEFIMNDCVTTTKQKNNKTMCIFLGIYCKSWGTVENVLKKHFQIYTYSVIKQYNTELFYIAIAISVSFDETNSIGRSFYVIKLLVPHLQSL